MDNRNMFATIALSLMNGHFICAQTNREAYQWLQREANYKEIAAHFEKINRKLTQTGNALAYYLAWGSDEEPNQKDYIKSVFQEIKLQVHPVINFLEFCISAEGMNKLPESGTTLHFTGLLSALNQHVQLQEKLNTLGAINRKFLAADNANKDRLSKVIATMVDWGYLAIIDEDRSIYQFTGKLDYFNDVYEFLITHENIVNPDEENVNDLIMNMKQESLI